MSDMGKILEVAKEAALLAGDVIKGYLGKKLDYSYKGSASNFATQADLEAEKVIISLIRKHFPDHRILSEEMGKSGGSSSFLWVIDPLDGTIGFTKNLPFFSVSIGVLKNDVPIVGVLNAVGLGRMYWASKGGGAFCDGKKIQVSSVSKLGEAVVGVDYGYVGEREEALHDFTLPLIEKVRYLNAFGGAACGLTLVSDGTLDAYTHNAFPWDFAAGSVIVSEAGGKVTGVDGKDINWNQERIRLVASNGKLHKKILEVLGT